MSFPYNIAQTAQYNRDTPTDDQRYQIVTVPAVLDPSGIEAEVCVVDGLAAHASNTITLGIEDGGATGTGTTDLDTPVGGTGGWTADTPVALTILAAAADLEADDWLNGHYDEAGTPGTTGGIAFGVNFVYGTPAGIA